MLTSSTANLAKGWKGGGSYWKLIEVNVPELTEVLDNIEFFELERTDRQVVQLALILYNVRVDFEKVSRVLGGA